MKAAIINHYGAASVLELSTVSTPVPLPDELLVRVQASSINPIDWKIRNGSLRALFGKRFPMILGYDVAGVVTQVGNAVTRFKIGDAVYSRSGNKTGGAYAEYVTLKENVVALKPSNLDFEQAAAVPLACLTALQALRDKANYMAGQHILILGGAGGVGSFAIQLCKAKGAVVTATCSTHNIDLVLQLGADHAIDYKRNDVAKGVDNTYDIIFDTVGKEGFWRLKHLLKRNGVFVSTHPEKEFVNQLMTLLTRVVDGKRARWILLKTNGADLDYVTTLIEAGQIVPLIDRRYKLDDIAEAHRYSETGKAKGKIVIDVA